MVSLISLIRIFFCCLFVYCCSAKLITESNISEIVLDNFAGNASRSYQMYRGVVLPYEYSIIAESIENFEVRDDDIWICSFPRSGTTWTQEMVWNIVNNLDFKGAQIPLAQRMPWIEETMQSRNRSEENHLKYVEKIFKLSSPRIIKTHLPFHLLPRQLRKHEKRNKIMYVWRNPKDVSISYYHFFKVVSSYSGRLEDFFEAFLDNKVVYAPYWNHINGYLEKKNNSNVLILTFEDTKSDLTSIIRKVARFLDKELNDQQLKELEDHLTFMNMQKNPAVNHEKMFAEICEGKGNSSCKEKFLRSGQVGQWKTVMSEEMINRFDTWIQANSKKFLKYSKYVL